MTLRLEPAIRSDVGRRANNEDAAFATRRLAAVADGVGGAAAGEVASRTIIGVLESLEKSRLDRPLPDALAETVALGNDRIGFVAACRPRLAGMSTTLTAVALDDGGAYVVANVGDSRTYLLRDERLARLTRDDSLVQALIDRGALTEEQAKRHPQRSVVLEALDGTARPPWRIKTLPACAGDRLLLCSDGVSDVLADAEIAEILITVADAEHCADLLVDRALAAGARDNVTAVVADVVVGADPAPLWPPALP